MNESSENIADVSRQRLAWLPSVFTAASLVAGFVSIVLVADPSIPNRFLYIPLLVGLAVFCDGIDGRVARAVGACSEFGEHFDSFADFVAFGIAPAFMVYQLYLRALPAPGAVAIAIAAAFVFANAFRLSRFAIKEYNPRFFEGMPTTAAGGLLASLAFWSASLPPIATAAIVLITSMLMNSRMQFPKLGQIVGRAPFMLKWTLLLATAVVLVPFQARIITLIGVAYIVYALLWSSQRALRQRFRRALPLAAMGLLPGPQGSVFSGMRTMTITEDGDEDEGEEEVEVEEDWEDDWESEEDQ